MISNSPELIASSRGFVLGYDLLLVASFRNGDAAASRHAGARQVITVAKWVKKNLTSKCIVISATSKHGNDEAHTWPHYKYFINEAHFDLAKQDILC